MWRIKKPKQLMKHNRILSCFGLFFVFRWKQMLTLRVVLKTNGFLLMFLSPKTVFLNFSFFLLTSHQLLAVKSTNIMHLSYDTSLPGSCPHSPRRVSPLLLTNPVLSNLICGGTDLFTSCNVNPAASLSVIWKPCKAYLGNETKALFARDECYLGTSGNSQRIHTG